MRLELKSRIEGGNGVGPARHPKPLKGTKGGKPRDSLVDDLVFEFDERQPGAPKAKIVTYCVACDRKAIGRDPNRIKQHAKNCSVRLHCLKKWPLIYANLKCRPFQRISHLCINER